MEVPTGAPERARSCSVGRAKPFRRARFRSMRAFEFYGQAFARWLKEQNEGRPVRSEKVEPGEEQILPDREQRELDALPSRLEA